MNVETTHKYFEVTIRDYAIDEVEAMYIQLVCEKSDVEFSISKSGRIILFSNIKDIKDLIKVLSEMGLAEDIGVIKEITEYWPEYADEDYTLNTRGDI